MVTFPAELKNFVDAEGRLQRRVPDQPIEHGDRGLQVAEAHCMPHRDCLPADRRVLLEVAARQRVEIPAQGACPRPGCGVARGPVARMARQVGLPLLRDDPAPRGDVGVLPPQRDRKRGRAQAAALLDELSRQVEVSLPARDAIKPQQHRPYATANCGSIGTFSAVARALVWEAMPITARSSAYCASVIPLARAAAVCEWTQ